jgi:hypothetical protein
MRELGEYPHAGWFYLPLNGGFKHFLVYERFVLGEVIFIT